jgi:hypothetical protein
MNGVVSGSNMVENLATLPPGGSLRDSIDESVRGKVIERRLAYWNSKLRGDAIPARRDIEPLDIPELLPQVILLDVARDPWNFRFRLIGTNVVYHLSQDWTGTWLREIGHMAPPSRIFNAYVEVAASGKPLRSQTPYVGPHQNFITAEDIILPLADDGQTVDMLLVFVEHFSRFD